MARDGSGNYHRPPGTDGAPDTTIESAKYNGFVADVEQDLNTPRPVIAGGTGANNARDAMITLGGEIAGQTVTNYDTHPFVAGSFSSLAGATAGPGVAVTGTCVIHSDPLYATLRAHETHSAANPGKSYVREKKAGSWLPWKSDGTTQVGDAEGIGSETADMFFGIKGTAPSSSFVINSESDLSGVNLYQATKAGGHFFLAPAAAYTMLNLNKSGAGMGVGIQGVGANLSARWLMYMGDGSAESGANVGSNFEIHRYSDTGAYLGRAMQIRRSDGAALIDNKLDVGGDVGVVGNIRTNNSVTVGLAGAAGGTVYFGSSGAQYITNNGVNFVHNGGDFISNGNVRVVGEVQIGSGANSSVLRFTNAPAGRYLYFDGTQYNLAGGDLSVGARIITSSDLHVMSSVAFGAVGTNKYMQFSSGALNIYNMTVAPNAGLSMTGGQILPMATTVVLTAGAGNAGLEVRSTGGSDAWFSFHRTGAYAVNFGLCNDHNLYLGGWSFGAVQYKVWTTRELTAALASIRTVYAGDFEHVYQNGMQEPYGSTAFVTGCQQGNGIATFRYRYLQMFQNGAWANIEAT